MIIIGIVTALVGVGMWLPSIWICISCRSIVKASIAELQSGIFINQYPYRVYFDFEGVSYKVDKQRGGYPLIGKKKLILVNRKRPTKIYFLVDLLFIHFMGIFFFFTGICSLFLN